VEKIGAEDEEGDDDTNQSPDREAPPRVGAVFIEGTTLLNRVSKQDGESSKMNPSCREGEARLGGR